MLKIQRIKPLSLLLLLPPQIIVAYLINGLDYLLGLGGVRESIALLGDGGALFFFAVSVPLTSIFGVLALIVFVAVYNGYNAGRDGLMIELRESGESERRLTRVEPASIMRAFVPALVTSLFLVVLTMGLGALITVATGAVEGYAQLNIADMLVMVAVVGTPIIAVIILGLYILAATLYNKVSGDDDGLRLRLLEDGDALILNRVRLSSLHFLLPSVIALSVISALLNMLVTMAPGGEPIINAVWSVAVSVPALYVSFAVFNAICGKRGIVFHLRKPTTSSTPDLLQG